MRTEIKSLVTLSLLLGCGDDAGESATCKRYKAALLNSAYDTEYITPRVNGSYDAYRCPSDEELAPQGDKTTLAACADYIEGLHLTIPLGAAARAECKNILIWNDRSARVQNTEVGEACTLSAVPNGGFTADDSYLSYNLDPKRCGGVGGCLRAPSDDPSGADAYCTCRCEADGQDVPVCACPGGYSCRDSLMLDRAGPGIRGSYCFAD